MFILNLRNLILMYLIFIPMGVRAGISFRCEEIFLRSSKNHSMATVMPLGQTFYFPVNKDGKSAYIKSQFNSNMSAIFFGIERTEQKYLKSSPSYEIGSLDRNSSVYLDALTQLKKTYDVYRSRGTVDTSYRAKIESLDSQLDPRHTSYIVFFNPQNNKPHIVLRIVDSSPTHFLKETSSQQKLPIEIDYPFLLLPEREQGNNFLIELGRLSRDEDVEGTLDEVLRQTATLLAQAHDPGEHFDTPKKETYIHKQPISPVIYIEAPSLAAVRLYKKYGFEVVFGPEDLRIQAGQKPSFILRASLGDFLRRSLPKPSLLSVPTE